MVCSAGLYRKLEKNEGIAGNTNQGFAMASGVFFALLDHDDLLHPCALWYAARAIAEQGADFVYTDEATFEGKVDNVVLYHFKPDFMVDNFRSNNYICHLSTFEGKVDNVVLYHFKPDFMVDNLRSNNYICHLSVFSRALMEAAGGPEREAYNGSQDYDLFLRLTEMARCIVHIPHALYYWRSSPGSTAADISAKTYCIDAGIAALRSHYQRLGVAVEDVSLIPETYWRSSPGSTAADISAKTYCIDAGIAALRSHYQRLGVAVEDVSLIPETPGYYKTDYVIDRPGRVSILIPTCDHAQDLETCVESIYARTTYPDFEVLLIENNSKEEATFQTYARLQKRHPENLRVLTWQGKGFNYSALNNFGAQYATGEYLLLLNNDTEVLTPRWLEEMVMYAQQKRVGCVGAKLLYPDDTVQHAGVGLGIGGVAGHLHKYFPAASDGYMGRLNYVQDVYAVTAACLLVRTEIYQAVGGLDESFAVAFNDVDFCVRVREAGYTNVFTPFAQLYHYESKSRGQEDDPVKQRRFQGEVLRFQQRWGKQLAAGDPCTNPNQLYHYESKSRGQEDDPVKQRRFQGEVLRFQQRWGKQLAAGDPCTNPNFDIQREDFSLKILPLE